MINPAAQIGNVTGLVVCRKFFSLEEDFSGMEE
jgi:hypothetical protein